MNPLNIVPSWAWAAMVVALAAVAGVQTIRVSDLQAEVARVEQAHDNTKLKYAEAARVAEAEARAAEQTLREQLDETRKAKQDEISTLRRDVRNLRSRLSDLSARPASDPGAEAASFGQAPVGCPGPVLYRDTAEALIDEAERADTIRIELKACYRSWDAARRATGIEAE